MTLKDPIDLEAVLELARLQCTDTEIAAELGYSTEAFATLTHKRRGLAETIERGRNQGKIVLRRLLWKIAEQGDVRTVTLLSKNMLGLSDKPEPAANNDDERPLRELSDEELMRIAAG